MHSLSKAEHMSVNQLITICSLALLQACEPSFLISGSWTRAPAKTGPSPSIIVAVLTGREAARSSLESDIQATLTLAGYKAVRSIDILPPVPNNTGDDQVQMTKLLQCGNDLLFTVVLADFESESRYVPGVGDYAPFGKYGKNFASYYDYWRPMVYRAGYVDASGKYFMEGCLFDGKTGQLLWSGQTEPVHAAMLERYSKTTAIHLWQNVETVFLGQTFAIQAVATQ
jgi:hypothetical protein